MRHRKVLLAAAVLSAAISSTDLAFANPPDTPRAEAAERFDRALRLVNEGDLSSGLAEFQRAYALVPSPVLLYNIGLVHAALRRPVASARALEGALSHPEALRPNEIERARQVLQEQTDMLGHVDVAANVKEGIVEVDNVEVAKLPLAGPLDVAGGPHIVGVISPGYAPARREIVVAGREHADVRLELVAIEGLLAHITVHCRVPAADVLVDGERVGKTPLEASITVAPGTHRVEVRRAAYLPVEREITLHDGARGELTLDPAVDRSALGREGGWLAIAPSERQTVLTVDGEEIGLITGPEQLPSGPHRLHLESGGFIPAERDVEVPLGETKALTVTFEPTPETRKRYVSAAESRRIWSWVTVGAGAALATAGVLFALAEQGRLQDAQNSLDAVNADWVRGSGRPCDMTQQVSNTQLALCESRLNNATDQVNNTQALRTAGWIAAGVGAAAMAFGVVFLVSGDDPHKYDQKPLERTLARWSFAPSFGAGGASLAVQGVF